MSYNPTFTQSYNGIFDKDSSIVSLEVGSNAYVTEREMNEIQYVRYNDIIKLVKEITDSGIILTSYDKSLNNQQDFKVINNDTLHLNSFEFAPFKAVINGNLITCENYTKGREDIRNLTVRLPNPPVANTRRDFVYLEMFFQELKESDGVKKFGGYDNNALDYAIIDERIEAETSRRIQLCWRIVVYEDRDNKYINGFLDADGNVAPITPLYGLSWGSYTAGYYQSADDEHLFIADDVIGTVDGHSYAIPLLSVLRLNNSGYSADNNPTGGIDYVDKDSVADRPDNKYSNVIYDDQITYHTHLASLGQKQYEKIFLTLKEYYRDQTILKNRLRSITYQFENVSNVLRNIGFTLPGIYDEQLYGIKMFRQLGRTTGAVVDDDNRKIVYRKRSYSVGHELASQKYAVVPTIVEYDYDNYGTVGDMYLTKEETKFSIYNTGAKGLKLDISAFLVDDDTVYMGEGIFNGTDGTAITMPFELNKGQHFVHIMPQENSNGRNGEIYVKFVDKDMIVYNTGVNTSLKGYTESTKDNSFQWVIIDTLSPKLKNYTCDLITLNGQDGKVVADANIGDNYHFMLGTPIFESDVDIPAGSIGELYADTEEDNQFTVYNTGEKDIQVQSFVFYDIPFAEYYDTLTVPTSYEYSNTINSIDYNLPEIVMIDKSKVPG